EDDVAIMMVEAEATDNAWTLIKEQGAIAPTEAVVAEGLEAAKVFIRSLCVAQQELAAAAAKPVREVPLFLDYQDDAYDVVEAAAPERLAEVRSIAAQTQREERTEQLLGEPMDELSAEGAQLDGRHTAG